MIFGEKMWSLKEVSNFKFIEYTAGKGEGLGTIRNIEFLFTITSVSRI